MSRVTKRKHVVRELLEERVEPEARQRIVRVLGTPGNNLHEVVTAEGTQFLASMPPRFRRHIWIKRGDFLLVDPIEEGTKVKAEISLVLLPPHVRFLQRQGLWPEAFAPLEKARESFQHPPEVDSATELLANPNRSPEGTEGDTSEDMGDSQDTSEDTGDSQEDTNEDTGDSQEDTSDKEEDLRDDEEDTRDKERTTRDSKEGTGGTKNLDEEDAGATKDLKDKENGGVTKNRGDKEDAGATKATGDKKNMGASEKLCAKEQTGAKDRGQKEQE